ncbi:MAG: efflux RND transporter periplasmic adaptor subunit [Calditrichaeota bacterium]|nr:MAG: efflux RND transporter periplasmic adaptor subunit [Calditrichota bacterium]
MKKQLKNKVNSTLSTALSLLVFMLIYSACSSENKESDPAGNRGANGGGMSAGKAAIPVQTAVVEKGDISTFLLHTTTIEAEKMVDVVAKVAGHVVKLYVEEGTRVKSGQMLAQLNEAELKIELIQAKVRMDTDAKAFERSKNMLEKNLIAKENHDTVEMQYESSKATWEAAKLKIEYTEVRAPISGIITSRNIELGQRVNSNETLFAIADFEPLRARIYVPEKDIIRVFEGQGARIQADALSDKEFSGKVTMISPVVDPANGTVKVTIDIDGAQKWLKPGMFASIYITTEKHENTLLIPKKAILLESETEQVYLMQEGRAHKVALKVGFSSGDVIEVLQGLEEGQHVVTIGQDGLREGLPIKIAGSQAAPAQIAEKSKKPAPANNTDKKPNLTQNGSRPETATKSGKKSNPSASTGEPTLANDDAKTKKSAPVDMQLLAQLEKEILESRMGRRMYEMKLQEEPQIENDPAKKMAYFNEFIENMLARISNRAPEVAEAFEEAVAKDPEMETNLLKQYRFLREKLSGMRGGGPRE